MLIIPVINFNSQKVAMSEIDNRELAISPWQLWKEAKENEDEESFVLDDGVENYVSDRIGFRNQMISAYTVMNDTIFNEMVHPTYTYGEDGYVFFNMGENIEYSSFHDSFVNMITEIQKYCDERNVPFYFVFQPSKTTVLQQYLPEGVNYNRDWANQMLNKMRDNGINVVDNTELLKNLEEEGTQVFNKQYDAGHWNDYGAYYGMNNLLDAMIADGISVQKNDLSDFDVSEETVTSLPASQFPINESIPVVDTKIDNLTEITKEYINEIELDSQYRYFNYLKNPDKKDSPKLMILQGSYMNTKGYKFLTKEFSEYIAIHDYQNTINFDYYYNIFQPEVVVVEVAEYACNSSYFNQERMEAMELNPILNQTDIDEEIKADESGLYVHQGNALTTLTWTLDSFNDCIGTSETHENAYVWMIIDNLVYDMRLAKGTWGAYECIIENFNFNESSEVQILYDDGKIIRNIYVPIMNNILEYEGKTEGVSQSKKGVVSFETNIEDNIFSYVLIQLQNSKTDEYMEPLGLKRTSDHDSFELEKYVHNAESGQYIVRLRANSNLSDEYIAFSCTLTKGETYYYGYLLNQFLSNEAETSDFFFGK